MEDTEQNKSEQATPFKLQRARAKGSVARGMDLGFLTALTAFAGFAWIMGPEARGMIGLTASQALVAAPNVLGGPNELLAVTGKVLTSAIRPLAFMAATIFATVLAFEIIQTGVVFSTEPLKPQFNRLNPAQNLKRLFSLRLLIETAKNILKLGAYITIAWLVIRDAQTRVALAISDAGDLAAAMAGTGLKLMISFAGAAVVFAALDQFITRRDFAKKMRMSRRELRREVRDREGEPRMKQRRKQLHGEFVKASKSLRGIRDADTLITNPTHYAVALRYDPATMSAPIIVSQGADHVARRLRRLAFLYGVVIVENRPLAQALYHKGRMDEEIPGALYQPVADIYTAMRKRAAKSGQPNA